MHCDVWLRFAILGGDRGLNTDAKPGRQHLAQPLGDSIEDGVMGRFPCHLRDDPPFDKLDPFLVVEQLGIEQTMVLRDGEPRERARDPCRLTRRRAHLANGSVTGAARHPTPVSGAVSVLVGSASARGRTPPWLGVGPDTIGPRPFPAGPGGPRAGASDIPPSV